MKLIYLFSALYICGCQSLQTTKTKSNWYQLQQVSKSDCFSWPLREGDLRIDHVIPVKGSKSGLLVSGLRRNSSPFAYFAPFQTDKPEPEDFESFQLTQGEQLIGAHSGQGQLIIASAINGDSGSKLVLQSLTAKRVLLEHNFSSQEILDGELISSRNGFWLLLKTSNHRSNAVFVALNNGRYTVHPISSQSWPNHPTLIPSGAEATALVVWLDDDSPPKIHTQALRESGSVMPESILRNGIRDLEVYAATARDQRLYIGLVEGDTMVGEAHLRVNVFRLADTGFTLEKSVKFALNDVHTSAPLFLDASGGLELVLLNWIDEESTIARYQIGSLLGSKPRFSGVFSTGMRIMGHLASPTEGDFVVTRHRSGPQWTFQQCRI